MVVTHKEYQYPDGHDYLPVQVGRALSDLDLGIQGDDTGENISTFNKSFCELTGLYWLWKNVDADVYGLVHYRRYFREINDKSLFINGKNIASSADLSDLMENTDIVLATKRYYVIDTVRSHYKHSHYQSDLEKLRIVLEKKHSEFLPAFDRVLSNRSLSLYNMFVIKKDMLNEYASWLFDILFELETQIPYKQYSPFQARVFGFLGERLLNVWVEKHRSSLRVKYMPVINLEGENKWLKVLNLLRRKFTSHT
jgi:hypothetical protein